MKMASGTTPVRDLRDAGVVVALGTDGAANNNSFDMIREMKAACLAQNAARRRAATLTAEDALEMATIEGARALHMEKEIGSLEPGKKADVVVLSLDVPNAVPMYDVYSQTVYALKASEVKTVVIDGRTVLADGKVLTVDEARVVEKAREYKKEIAESLK